MITIVLCCISLAADPATSRDPSWGLATIEVKPETLGQCIKIVGKVCHPVPGVMVSRVIKDGAAETAGLNPGDIITMVANKQIKTKDDLRAVFKGTKPGQSIAISVRRYEQSKIAKPRAADKHPWEWTRVDLTLIVGEAVAEKSAIAAGEGPLVVLSATIGHNAINVPILTVKVRAKENIEAWELEAACFDKFGEEVKAWGFGDSAHRAMSQKTLSSGAEGSASWILHGSEGAGVIKCHVTRVKLGDGTVWKPAADKPIAFETQVK